MAEAAPLPALVTSRLVLRAPRRDDAPVLARLIDDPGVARMTTSIPHPYSADMARAWLERVALADSRRNAVFALETPADGFAGVVGFHATPSGAPELGYWLGRPFWGRGYMTEAVGAALAWAGEAWGKRYVTAGHFADNVVSGTVLIKAGFLYTGDVRSLFSAARGEEAATRMMVWLA